MLPIDIPKFAQFHQKRYETDFKELGKIGKGGFSKVYKVQNQVDKQMYAIKKVAYNILSIIFQQVELKAKENKDNFEVKLERVLREARYLAKLHHPKIIRYFNSWVEVTEKEKKPTKPIENLNNYQNFNKKNKHQHNELSDLNDKNQDIVLYFDSKNSLIESQESLKSMDQLVQFQPCDDGRRSILASPNLYSPNESQIRQLKKPVILDFLNHKALEKEKKKKKNSSQQKRVTLGDFDKILPNNTNVTNEHISYSEFDLEVEEVENHVEKPIPQQRIVPRLSFTNLKNLKKSISQECKNPKNEFDLYEKIIIYIQTEICEKTLEDYLNERNQNLSQMKKNETQYQKSFQQSMQEAQAILGQIIQGLEYIHRNRLIHRDLKPGNIFMNNPNDVKIGDFGLVKEITQLLEHVQPHDTFDIMDGQKEQSENEAKTDLISNGYCTKLYASPEQMDCSPKFKNFDHRIDIHALGMIILQLFHPMTTQMELIITMNDARKGVLPKVLFEKYQNIANVIVKCLSKDPNARPTLENIISEIICYSPSSSVVGTQCGTSTTHSNHSDCVQHPLTLLGSFQVQCEGSQVYKQRTLQIQNRELLVYKSEIDQKANQIYNLDECRVELDTKDNCLFVCIAHSKLKGCTIQFHEKEKDIAFQLFDKVHYGLIFTLQKNNSQCSFQIESN